ncbi:Mitochondrial outer membrane protein iml2 [Cryomyces antarcticus]|uniref:Mitochondrial outer membrane protein iml2 n=1 Tax=Cryomyces antarcticus TaxID=329879 RepID=A0ABR0M4C0_9PEZI|nr:Mitochondrial outer membrane protein iml2 [Cryomyces antarcticus]KAK5279933.1 Mitochondrial outer membrane protein iml2 [Cryomyces antarcticus]
MAVNLWTEMDAERSDRAMLRECSGWLEKVGGWESYELDARIGLKVTTARDTLKKYDAGAA